MNLRPYQAEASASVDVGLAAGGDNLCVVIPTAGGKTIVIADLIRKYLTAWPGTRILVLAHVKELVKQNAEKLAAYWPEGKDKIGVYSAGLGSRDVFNPVIFASIQSVWSKARQVGRFDLVFIDEAHRIPLSGEGTYRALLAELRGMNQHVRVVGFTATPYRMGAGMVCGKGYILHSICYEANVADLIGQGFLSRVVTPANALEGSVSSAGLHVSRGEYVSGEVEDLVNQEDVVQSAVSEIVKHGAGRRGWIIFAHSIAHAERVSSVLAERGVHAPVVHSKIQRRTRDDIIARFCTMEFRAVVNVNVLSEGFDAPHIDLVALLRPTKSPGLYYQQVGRGLRLSAGKKDCLILDFAGNIAEHGPIDSIKVRTPKKESGGAPEKECPKCHAICPLSAKLCEECGHVFSEGEEDDTPPHAGKASDGAILSADAWRPKEYRVSSAFYFYHQPKDGRKPTLRIEYLCQGGEVVKEWLGVEHGGFSRDQAAMWWRSTNARLTNSGSLLDMPDTIRGVIECLGSPDVSHDIPTTIKVKKDGRYQRVISRHFSSDEAGVVGPGVPHSVGPEQARPKAPRRDAGAMP